MSFIEKLAISQKQLQPLAGMAEKQLGVTLGIVANVDDPRGMGRVKAVVATKPDGTTDWLQRLTDTPFKSPQVPTVGQTVAIFYLGGDAHVGFYLMVQNLPNPASEPQHIRQTVEEVQQTIEPDSSRSLVGEDSEVYQDSDRIRLSLMGNTVEVDDSSIALTVGTTSLVLSDGSLTINGSQVLSIGSVDSAGDVNVSKGWT